MSSDDHRDEAGRFSAGNRFWEARSSAGPKPKFADPEALWASCVEYFEWVEDNPLHEAKAFAFQGEVTVATLPKMRAMTIAGLCLFLDVTEECWRLWRTERPDLLGVMTRAEAIIRDQKFSGAAADLLNPNIIARDLGLTEKHQHANDPDNPLMTQSDDQELARRALFLLTKLEKDKG